MKSRFFLGILLLVFASGCISPEIQKGSPYEYELPGLNNTTIFYLNGSSVQVIENVINTTSASIIIGESGGMSFRDPVAVDYSGNSTAFNVSKEIVFGRVYARFNFGSNFSGFVAFTQPGGQDFSYPLMKNGSIRIVLPVNFTTGSRFLGIAQPEPDNITTDASGREVLIWKNPYPGQKEIKVKYYQKSAPIALFYFFIFFLVAALVIFGYYKLSIRALKKKSKI